MPKAHRGGLSPNFSLKESIGVATRDIESFKHPRSVEAARRLFEVMQKLEEKSQRDPKTGLLAYPVFKERVKEIIEGRQEAPRGKVMSILIADLDDFKKVNSIFGLDFNKVDEVCLKPAARVVEASVSRKGDTLSETSRFGGEEFLVFLDGTDKEGALYVAEKIRKGINAITYDVGDGPEILGVSIGIYSFEGGSIYEDVFAQAGAALEQAKEIKGKNSIVTAQYMPN